MRRKNDSTGYSEDRDIDPKALIHELQVHQIELEMQNEELKRSRKEVEDALARYSDLYDFAPICLFTLDVKGLIKEVNLAGAALLGVDRRFLMNHLFHMFVSREDRPSFDLFFNRAFEVDTRQKCELKLRKDKGPEIYVQIEGIAGGKGTENGLMLRIAVIDITERKIAEDELQKAKETLEQRVMERTINLATANRALVESEERFRVALKNTPIVVFNQDRDLRYTWIYNAPPGITPDKILGKRDEDLFPPDEAAIMTAIKSRVLKTEVAEREEIETTINGTALFYDYTIEPLRDTNGEVVGITCAAMDTTLRREAEEKLREAKEAAEDAVRTKSEFLANMSHEIRTPMNAVIGMTSLLLEEEMPSEQKDYVETIRSCGDALLSVINDILDFSKIESDKVILEDQPFELRASIEDALNLVAADASAKGLSLDLSIDEGVPQIIVGDPARLRQILINLLGNAVKFTKQGGVRLAVTTGGDPGEVHFAVKDTGIGIPRDRMDRLFLAFSQVDGSTTRLYGGTGLGLAISRKLVELMGGRIWAESEQGLGSTFHFTIQAAPVAGVPAPAGGVSASLMGKRVLIVDSERTNRLMLSRQTNSWGMVPSAAASGQEALEWIQRGDEFDIAILDMDAPDIDGPALADKIREDNKALPLVILTRVGKPAPTDHAYLVKPVKPSQLYGVLVEVFSKQSPRETTQHEAEKVPDKPARILLAEDNASSQKVAVSMLKRLGYRPDIAANGLEALQALERQQYDVVLMDVRMPEMDGLEATRIIRQRWPNNGPKIIAITAYALEGDKELCLEAGMDDYIPKPMKMEDLKAALERTIRS